VTLFQDLKVGLALKNTFLFAVMSVPAQLVVSLGLALLLNSAPPWTVGSSIINHAGRTQRRSAGAGRRGWLVAADTADHRPDDQPDAVVPCPQPRSLPSAGASPQHIPECTQNMINYRMTRVTRSATEPGKPYSG
jgi:hypothetical protein